MSIERKYFIGLTEIMVLACLLQKPCCCHEIVKLINIYFDDKYKIGHSVIFTLLYLLKEKNLVGEQNAAISESRERVYYNILPEGKKYFEEGIKEYRAYTCTIEKVLENSKKLIE